MKKSTKKRKAAYLESAKKSSPSLELVILDQKPIRKKIISSCKKTIKDLDKARSELSAFEKKDIPEYNRWYNQNFDSELSDVKIAHEKAGDAYRLIQEIEEIRSRYSISYYEAYKLALDKRKNPEKYKQERKEENHYEEYGEDEEDDDPNDYYEEEHKYSEDDLLKIFKNFLRSNPDLEEMAKNKKNFTILFEKFKQEFNRKGRTSSTKQQEPREKPKSEKGIIEQVKSVYRMLARKLHPDYRKETGEHYEILWFEAQAAYKSNNLEKLQTLLSQCSAYEGNFSEEFSIYQIVTAKKNYGLQLKTVRSRIKLAKKDPAWGFSKISHKEAKYKSVEIKNRLKRELSDHKENLIHFNEILKKWSTPPIKSKKSYNKNQYSGLDDDDYITFLF
jgi:hypothetical protein